MVMVERFPAVLMFSTWASKGRFQLFHCNKKSIEERDSSASCNLLFGRNPQAGTHAE